LNSKSGVANMDEEEFRKFLRRDGRSQSAIKRCISYVKEFERYLRECQGGKRLEDAISQELEEFVEWIEKKPKISAKTRLWALRYYYEYASNEVLRNVASELRQRRIKRVPFALRGFRGIDPEYLEKLAAVGIRNVEQMLDAGRTRNGRQQLSTKTSIPINAILELVKLSDLARIPGVKGIRARLYYDAGVDRIEKMAEWDPKALRTMLIEFVERTRFDGIAPLPKEAIFSVEKAKKLPKTVEY
jgi:hypothetical protein